MLALCVDDEQLLLSELVRAAEKSPDIDKTVAFKTYTEALEWAQSNSPDIAFLDVKLRGHTGIELAEKLHELHPALPIIFCTGYKEYAIDAFRVHAIGYITKPVTEGQLQQEIDVVKSLYGGKKKPLLTVNCFGNFDVLSGGKPVHFGRKRAKEVLAFLIDRRGASVTAKEICAVLFEDEGDSDKNLMHFYKIAADLKTSLAAVGAENVFVKDNYNYYVDTSLVECDYYEYLNGNPAAEKKFCGEYMLQYSWAEETAALLA